MNIHSTVVPAKPDGYHLTGTIISTPNDERPYYSVNFECSDGQIENVWLTENEMKPGCERCGVEIESDILCVGCQIAWDEGSARAQYELAQAALLAKYGNIRGGG